MLTKIISLILGISTVLLCVQQLDFEPYRSVDVPFPGTVTLSLQGIVQWGASLSGAWCLGSLVFAVCCTRTVQRKNTTKTSGLSQLFLGPRGYAGLRTVERVSPLWILCALGSAVASSTAQIGRTPWDLREAEDPIRAVISLISVSERAGAWLVVALLTTILAVASRFALRWTSCVALTVLTTLAVIAPWVTQNAGDGPNHDLATGAAVWVSVGVSLLLGLMYQCAGEWSDDRQRAQHRARLIGAVAVGAVVVGAAILGYLFIPLTAITGTVYGWCAVATVGCGVVFFLASLANKYAVAVVAGSVVLAITEVMSIQPAPVFTGQGKPTASQLLVGYDFPGPPTLARVVEAWRFDLVFGVIALLLGAGYLAAARQLRHRGDSWSPWRTTSFIVGCFLLLVVTSSGLGRYASGQFSYHMMLHMGLNMFVPVFLVLGAPVTLLLRVVPPQSRRMAEKSVMPGFFCGPREWVLALVHSRFVQLLAHPLIAVGLFVISLYGLYFTSLFGKLVQYHWGHLLMTGHFLLIGYTYYWAIIGIDPGARKLPHLARLGMLFAVMPFHAFFGVAVLSSEEIIGGSFYRWLALPWTHDLAADQRVAGAVAWTSGEIPIVFVVGALLYQWARADRRDAARADRHAMEYEDAELTAYNDMLSKLVERR